MLNGSIGLLEPSTPRALMRANIAGGATSVSVDLGDSGGDDDLLTPQIYDAGNNPLGATTLAIDPANTVPETGTLALTTLSLRLLAATRARRVPLAARIPQRRACA